MSTSLTSERIHNNGPILCAELGNSIETLDVTKSESQPQKIATRQRKYQQRSWDFSAKLDAYIRDYANFNQSIPVNFRQIVDIPYGSDRASHLIHGYPAKILPAIPLFLLNCRSLVETDSLVVDPFCGTGTTLIEAKIARMRAAGADSNPLARLIAAAKTGRLDVSEAHKALNNITVSYKAISPASFAPVVSASYWFNENTAEEIGRLVGAINELRCLKIRQFFQVCLSSCLKRLSYADLRLSVPVRRKDWQSQKQIDPIALFIGVAKTNLRRLENYQEMTTAEDDVVILDDARNIGRIESVCGKADLIITSPPYGGAQKYIRSSSLSIGWLDLAPNNKLRLLEVQNIGREHYNKNEYQSLQINHAGSAADVLRKIHLNNRLRAHIASNYLAEMSDALKASFNLLKHGGHLVLVIGNNKICGHDFMSSEYLSDIVRGFGATKLLELVDDIKSYGLMTKRNKTASIISQEHILIFRK